VYEDAGTITAGVSVLPEQTLVGVVPAWFDIEIV
jgi:hypothetical protein